MTSKRIGEKVDYETKKIKTKQQFIKSQFLHKRLVLRQIPQGIQRANIEDFKMIM